MTIRDAWILATVSALPLAAAELPALRVRPQTIDSAIQIGYGLAIADVDGDGKLDIIAAGRSTKNVVIYWNETRPQDIRALRPRDRQCHLISDTLRRSRGARRESVT